VRQYDESLAEDQRKTDLDEAYRRDTLNWDQYTDARDYAEKVRQYDQSLAEDQRQADLDEAYRRDTLGWNQYTDARDYAEQVRQADLDEKYRRDSLAQDQAQFDSTTKLNYDKLAQDQAQFDANLTEEQRQYNQNIAIDYVSSILANGEIPSNELLVAAGLSYEDAQKLVKKATAGTKPKQIEEPEEEKGTQKDITFKQASEILTQDRMDNDPNRLLGQDYDAYKGSTKTYGDLKNQQNAVKAKVAEDKAKEEATNNAYLQQREVTPLMESKAKEYAKQIEALTKKNKK